MRQDLSVYCDGGARGNPGPGAAAFVVLDREGKLIAKSGIFLGQTTNNQAEYKAVLLALSYLENISKAWPFGLKQKARLPAGQAKNIIFFLDSELVVNQLTGKYRIKDKDLQPLAMEVKKRESALGGPVTYRAIPRRENRLADFLVNKILDENI